jgi:hypothetical protein
MNPPDSTSPPPAGPNPAPDQNKSENGFYKVAGDITKFTIFAVFVLYSIGFIVWHSYLGSYGVSSVEFLQSEYLAAAFCYLFFLAAFALPPFLVLIALYQNMKAKGLRHIKEWDDKVFVVILVWNLLSVRTIQVFLPDNQPFSGKVLMYLGLYVCIMLFHLLMIVIFFIYIGLKGGHFMAILFGKPARPFNWKESLFYKLAIHREYLYLYILTFELFILFTNTKINREFLHSTMFLSLWVLITVGYQNKFQTLTSRMMMHVLIVFSTCLLLVLNIQSFAVKQFKEIPKTVGGGKPETAYIKFTSNNSDIPASLDIAMVTNAFAGNGFYGPIGILLRTESEIVFINYSDIHTPAYITNSEVLNLTTNRIVTLITNRDYSSHKYTISKLTAWRITTNGVDHISENIFNSSTNFAARQVRSDAIDSIIFTPNQ